MENEQLLGMIASYEVETDQLKKAHQGSQIASFLLLDMQDEEEALQYIQEVMETLEQASQEPELAIILFEIGELYKMMQDSDKAKPILLKAISIGKKFQDDTLLIKPYLCLGHIYVDELNHSMALEYFHNALKISENLKDQRLIGASLAGVGRAYLENRDYQKALPHIRQALKILPQKTPQKNACYVNLGITHAYLGDYVLAVGYFKRVIPLLKEINYKAGIAEMYCRIGEAYVKNYKYKKALKFAYLARDYIAENQINITKLHSYVCLILIRVHAANNNIEEAQIIIDQFLSLNETNREYLYSFYDIATNFYAKQQRYDLAFKYITKRYELGRIIFDEEMQRNMAIKAANFEYEREKQKAELLKEKKEQLEFVINNAYESIFMVSGETFTLVNDAFYTMTGWNLEKLYDVNTRFIDIIDPIEREKVWAYIMKNVENQLPHFEVNTRVINLDGELIDVEIHFSNISIDNELRLIGIIHDIAQKKLFEEQKLHYERINTIITVAITTNDFINSPLMAIQGYVEKLQEDIRNSKPIPDKTFKNIYQSVHIIKEKMHELVDFANNPNITSIPTKKYSHTEYTMLSLGKRNEGSQ